MQISPRACFSAVALIGGMFAVLLATAAAARADYTVNICRLGYLDENVFKVILPPDGSVTGFDCSGTVDGSLGLSSSRTVSASMGESGALQASAPAGLEIVGASAPGLNVVNINIAGMNWGGGVYWQGGSAQLSPANSQTGGAWSGLASPYFGFRIVCETNPCPAASNLVTSRGKTHERRNGRGVNSRGRFVVMGLLLLKERLGVFHRSRTASVSAL